MERWSGPNRMTTCDLVIFDCDGVLVDTESVNNEVISILLKDAGLEMPPEEVGRRTTGLAYWEMWEMFQDEVAGPLPADILERQLDMELERLRKTLLPMPGAVDAVRYLADAGMPISEYYLDEIVAYEALFRDNGDSV